MVKHQPKFYAVLTGDIIRSRKLKSKELESVRDCLATSVGDVATWKAGIVYREAEFYRGDEWQLLLGDPALALRVAIFLIASLRAHGLTQTKVSIGLGTIELLHESRTALSFGEAFVLSGHGLDAMKKSILHLDLPSSAGPLMEWVQMAVHMCDAILKKWTVRQAEIITFASKPSAPTHVQIADKLEVRQQSVNSSLQAANWKVVKEVIDLFEKTKWSMVLSEMR